MTEKQFVFATMDKLKKHGADCVRVESASTISGFPDLWCQFEGNDYFIEFKSTNTNIPAKVDFEVGGIIHWRPGQQAWAARYRQHHVRLQYNEIVLIKHSWTFVKYKDAVVLIRMDRLFENDKVQYNQPDVFVLTLKEWATLDLKLFLQVHTYTVFPVYSQNKITYAEYFVIQAEVLLQLALPQKWPFIDKPVPSDYIQWDLDKPVQQNELRLHSGRWSRDIADMLYYAIKNYKDNIN